MIALPLVTARSLFFYVSRSAMGAAVPGPHQWSDRQRRYDLPVTPVSFQTDLLLAWSSIGSFAGEL